LVISEGNKLHRGESSAQEMGRETQLSGDGLSPGYE